MTEYTFTRKRDGSYQVDSYEGISPVLDIPSQFDGHPVTSIAEATFELPTYTSIVVVVPPLFALYILNLNSTLDTLENVESVV